MSYCSESESSERLDLNRYKRKPKRLRIDVIKNWLSKVDLKT